jgi:hypothetical protein
MEEVELEFKYKVRDQKNKHLKKWKCKQIPLPLKHALDECLAKSGFIEYKEKIICKTT